MVRHSAAALTLCLFSLAAWTHALGPIPLSAVPEVVMSSDTPSRPSWETAAFFGPFLRLDGLSLPDAATSARVCRTAEALRLKVDCAEPRMDRVKSAVRARDADVWKDDCVEVFVQRPGQEYLHFVVNPAGAQFDERGRDASWDAKWRAEAERGEDRWSVQLEFSWAVFGGPPRDGETWGLNIARSRTPEHELSTWSPTGSGFHVPERFGKIVFSRAPYPTNVRWQLIGRRNGRVDVTWEPAAEATGLRLDVNGTATRRKFQIGTEGAVPLTLTAKRKGEVIFRALSVADVMPIQHALAAAHRRLEAVPAAVSAETDAARAALGGELGSLEQLGAAAPANVAAQVVKLADALSVRSSHLAVKAEMLRNKAKPDSIFYGVERSLTKLLRHEPFSGKPGGALHLDAARREMDAGQVVLFADNVPLLTVRAKMSAATGPKGKTLLATAFRVRRVGYIPTIKPVYAIEHVGLWPDPLLDVTAFDIREKSFESLWIDVRVPEDAAPGDYSGELTLTAANKRSTTVPVQVRVRDFTIPVRSSVCTAFGVNPGYRIKQDSDAYIRNALEHRITPYSVAGAPVLVSPPALDWHDARRIEFELTTDRAGTLSFYLTPAADRPPRRFE
ncbi:MAG: carbohydrate-binding family 9-like protein, partial [Lentisphaerae bacterium]|nr:carbohydrate-binding family 9-like protein [Lentisphaerota bacterium]